MGPETPLFRPPSQAGFFCLMILGYPSADFIVNGRHSAPNDVLPFVDAGFDRDPTAVVFAGVKRCCW